MTFFTWSVKNINSAQQTSLNMTLYSKPKQTSRLKRQSRPHTTSCMFDYFVRCLLPICRTQSTHPKNNVLQSNSIQPNYKQTNKNYYKKKKKKKKKQQQGTRETEFIDLPKWHKKKADVLSTSQHTTTYKTPALGQLHVLGHTVIWCIIGQCAHI